MTNDTRKRLELHIYGYLATFVVGAILGAGVIFYFSLMPVMSVLSISTLSQNDDNAYIKYRYGAYGVARAAVLELVRLEEAIARREEVIRTRSQTDFMVWYGRLAVIAERAGAVDDVKEFWRRAVEAGTRNGRPITENEVREVVAKLDARLDARLAGAGS